MTAIGTGPIVVVGGGPVTPEVVDVPDTAVVIAVDRGYDHALALGLLPTILVGDLDSISEAGVAHATANGITINRHPADKDATDLELALELAVGAGDHVVLIDSAAGRLDHAMANLLLAASDRWSGTRVTVLAGATTVTVVRGSEELTSTRGAVVSLLPVGGPATVTTTGLRWPLHGEELAAGSSRGISNEFVAERATVTVDAGVVLAIQSG